MVLFDFLNLILQSQYMVKHLVYLLWNANGKQILVMICKWET